MRLEFSIPNIIVIGVPDCAVLERVRRKLERHQIHHYCWTEPDYDYGFTAIATEPLSPEARAPLSNYRLWKDNAGGPAQAACRVTPDSGSNSGVAQAQSTGP